MYHLVYYCNHVATELPSDHIYGIYSTGYDPVDVSWWEKDHPLVKTVSEVSAYSKTSILHLKNLNQVDGGRRITCRENKPSGSKRTVILKYRE